MRRETKTLINNALKAIHDAIRPLDDDPPPSIAAAVLESIKKAESASAALGSLSILLAIAGAEDRVEEEVPRYGKFNLLGHSTFVGEVVGRPHAGAYTVRYTQADGYGVVSEGTITTEAVGRHSIEWMTDEEHAAWLAALRERAAVNAMRHKRRTTIPDGYSASARPEWPCFAFIAPGSSQIIGWWDNESERNENAWDHLDGDLEVATNDEGAVVDEDHGPRDGGGEPPF